MAVVKAQITDSTSPTQLFSASADCVVNVFSVNPTTSVQASFVEVRLGGSTQVPAQLLVPGYGVKPLDRSVEGPVYLASGDQVFVYGGSTAQVWHLYGQTV